MLTKKAMSLCLKRTWLLLSYAATPYAGITRIRFKGYVLSRPSRQEPCGTPESKR
jgi:hypothetical protein